MARGLGRELRASSGPRRAWPSRAASSARPRKVGPDTIWIITDHDPDRGVVVFARVTPGLAASTLHIEVAGSADGTSAVSIRYTVVPTSPEGEAYAAERYDRADLLASIVWWERSMNHYLRTGRLLRRDDRGTTSDARAAGPGAKGS